MCDSDVRQTMEEIDPVTSGLWQGIFKAVSGANLNPESIIYCIIRNLFKFMGYKYFSGRPYGKM